MSSSEDRCKVAFEGTKRYDAEGRPMLNPWPGFKKEQQLQLTDDEHLVSRRLVTGLTQLHTNRCEPEKETPPLFLTVGSSQP